MANFYKICDLFPYDAYDPKTKIFYNQESLGFVIETAPLVGASSEMQKEVSNLFALALPEESSLQVLLWADPHIGDQLDAYQAARAGRRQRGHDGAPPRGEAVGARGDPVGVRDRQGRDGALEVAQAPERRRAGEGGLNATRRIGPLASPARSAFS